MLLTIRPTTKTHPIQASMATKSIYIIKGEFLKKAIAVIPYRTKFLDVHFSIDIGNIGIFIRISTSSLDMNVSNASIFFRDNGVDTYLSLPGHATQYRNYDEYRPFKNTNLEDLLAYIVS
jgi:hypothetical protein